MAGIVAALLILVLVGAMAYIRLAPSDPAVWHVDPASVDDSTGSHQRLLISQSDPQKLLADLDAIALATPRTVRLAGSPDEGRITWVTRSAFFGFPDYTTAEARQDGPTTQLILYARQRFGRGDYGVNAARLKDWLARLGVD